MRFLHTADWHLGRTMRGKSRAPEFEAVLAELVEIARAERVDVVLVCGDIWDTPSPSPESDRLLYETLRALIGLHVQVVLVAGKPRQRAQAGGAGGGCPSCSASSCSPTCGVRTPAAC